LNRFVGTCHVIGSIVPALAQIARTGHPQFLSWNGKQSLERTAHPPSFAHAGNMAARRCEKDLGHLMMSEMAIFRQLSSALHHSPLWTGGILPRGLL